MAGRGQVRSVTDGFFRSKKGFTVVQNEITRDRDISLKAKGLYLVIQANITMPDKRWRKEDFKSMTCEGKKAFDGAWNELKEAGYNVSSEDFDFEDLYQMIIKIEKQAE